MIKQQQAMNSPKNHRMSMCVIDCSGDDFEPSTFIVWSAAHLLVHSASCTDIIRVIVGNLVKPENLTFTLSILKK